MRETVFRIISAFMVVILMCGFAGLDSPNIKAPIAYILVSSLWLWIRYRDVYGND